MSTIGQGQVAVWSVGQVVPRNARDPAWDTSAHAAQNTSGDSAWTRPWCRYPILVRFFDYFCVIGADISNTVHNMSYFGYGAFLEEVCGMCMCTLHAACACAPAGGIGMHA